MFTLKFEGGNELAANLSQLSDRLSRSIQREALRHAADPMRKDMAVRAPHEPGKPDLRDTMAISNAQGQDANEVAIAVGPTKAGFYGSFQELGTAFHPAQPFVRPAFDVNVSRTLKMIAEDLWASMAAKGLIRTATDDGGLMGGPGGSLT